MRAVAERGVDTLFLDTTYLDERCAPRRCRPVRAICMLLRPRSPVALTHAHRYAFAPQHVVLAQAADAAAAALAAAPRCLLCVGMYAIGKERVVLAIARRLRCRVFVDGGRAALISCFEGAEAEELQGRLTRAPEETPLHVLPIGALNERGLRAHLAEQNGRFDRALGFKPTGWTHGQAAPRAGGAPAAGRVRVLGIPYSEHSSFDELRDFVRMLRPRRVVPTVNVGDRARRQYMEGLLRRWATEKPE